MKKTSFLILFVVASAIGISLSAIAETPDKKETTDTRTLKIDKRFTGLQSYAGIEITYTQDTNPSRAIINGPSEIVNKITWEVDSKGVLSFTLPKQNKGYKGKITIQLNGGLLTNYNAISGSTINVTTAVKAKEPLNFAVYSSANIILRKDVEATGEDINIAGASSGEVIFLSSVKCEDVNIALASSSTVKIPTLYSSATRYAGSSTGILEIGTVDIQEFDIALASGGECNLKEGKVDTLNIACASGGEFIGHTLTIGGMALSASSGGTITIKGECESAEMAAASGGNINVGGLKISKIKAQKSSSGGSINI